MRRIKTIPSCSISLARLIYLPRRLFRGGLRQQVRLGIGPDRCLHVVTGLCLSHRISVTAICHLEIKQRTNCLQGTDRVRGHMGDYQSSLKPNPEDASFISLVEIRYFMTRRLLCRRINVTLRLTIFSSIKLRVFIIKIRIFEYDLPGFIYRDINIRNDRSNTQRINS